MIKFINQKGFVNIILVVVIVILLGAVGYFVFIERSKPVAQQSVPTPTQEINTPPKPSSSQSPISTPTATSETANWLPFKSSYFTLSFKVPPGFEVKEGQSFILVAKSPYYTRDIGDDNAFFSLTRYNQKNTRESELALYRKLLKNLQESNTIVDGSSFLTLKGDDWGRFEGDSAGKVVVVFFNASWLEIIERPADSDQNFNPIAIGNQVLSTFRFSK